MKIIYRAEIFQEGDIYVSQALDLYVSSSGDTPQDASDSLEEAVDLFLENCEELGTLHDVLEESGFEKEGDTWRIKERISQNKVAVLN